MRVMVFVKGNSDTEAGVMPGEEMLTAMGKYNEELVNAGIMLDGDGLKPLSESVRVKFAGNDTTVRHGPFPESKDVVAGYWMWQVGSMDEAIEWARRCPSPTGAEGELEIRPFYEVEDFGDAYTPAVQEQQERLRARMEQRKQQRGS